MSVKKPDQLFHNLNYYEIHHVLMKMIINFKFETKEERESLVSRVNKSYQQKFNAKETETNTRENILSNILHYFFDTILNQKLSEKVGAKNSFTAANLKDILTEVVDIYSKIGININDPLFQSYPQLKDFNNFKRLSNLTHEQYVTRICLALKCVVAAMYDEKFTKKTELIKIAFQKYLDDFKKLRVKQQKKAKVDPNLIKKKEELTEKFETLKRELALVEVELEGVEEQINPKKKQKKDDNKVDKKGDQKDDNKKKDDKKKK
eukprot:gene3881-7095_t